MSVGIVRQTGLGLGTGHVNKLIIDPLPTLELDGAIGEDVHTPVEPEEEYGKDQQPQRQVLESPFRPGQFAEVMHIDSFLVLNFLQYVLVLDVVKQVVGCI
jgi:hypothetical protein